VDNDDNELPDITWFNEQGRSPDWASINHTLAALIDGAPAETSTGGDDDFYLMFNASSHSVAFALPKHPRRPDWGKAIDTAAPAPFDISPLPPYPRLAKEDSCLLAPRSLVVLVADRSAEKLA